MINITRFLCCKNKGFGLFLLRVFVGVIFLSHGWEKFYYMEETIGFFTQFNIPAFLAYVVATIETLGGIALILGIFTRVAAPLLALVMVGAVVLVKWKVGYPAGGFLGAFRISEIDIMLFVSSVTVALSGAGMYSLAKFSKLGCRHEGACHSKMCKVIGCEDSSCKDCSFDDHECGDGEHHHGHSEEVKMNESVREMK